MWTYYSSHRGLLSRNWGVCGADGCRLGRVGAREEGHTPTGSPVDGAKGPCPASQVLGATGSEAPSRPEDRAPRLSLAPRETGRGLSPKGVRTRALVYVTESLFMAWKRRTSCHCFQKSKNMENFWQEQRKELFSSHSHSAARHRVARARLHWLACSHGLRSRKGLSFECLFLSEDSSPSEFKSLSFSRNVCVPQCCPQFSTKHAHTQTKQPLRQGPKRTPAFPGLQRRRRRISKLLSPVALHGIGLWGCPCNQCNQCKQNSPSFFASRACALPVVAWNNTTEGARRAPRPGCL